MTADEPKKNEEDEMIEVEDVKNIKGAQEERYSAFFFSWPDLVS